MTEAFAKRVTKKYRYVDFKEGDEVLLLNARKRSRKGGRIEADYTGPYVIQVLLGKTATLKTMQGDCLKTKYNISHLKPYKRSSVAQSKHSSASDTTAQNFKRKSVIVCPGQPSSIQLTKTEDQTEDIRIRLLSTPRMLPRSVSEIPPQSSLRMSPQSISRLFHQSMSKIPPQSTPRTSPQSSPRVSPQVVLKIPEESTSGFLSIPFQRCHHLWVVFQSKVP